MNQHTQPHWPDLDEQLMVRFPGDMYDMLTDAAKAEGISINEYIRRTLHHHFTGRSLP
jgi:predicted HicB family RNase H-like nuclease